MTAWLGIAANIAQLVSIVPLFAIAVGLYQHHRCGSCWRLVLGHHGHQGKLACHRHL